MNDGAADKAAEMDRGDAPEVEAGQGGTEATAAAQSAGDLGTLERELAETNDKLLRLAAELDNTRKRNAREVENARKYGVERFAQALLPVIDSLEAALTAENADAETLLEGQKATLKLVEHAFRDAGIAPIDPRGAPFDPNLHEAMSLLPVPGAPPDSVVEVIQKGYALKERLLRPARVVVARTPEPD